MKIHVEKMWFFNNLWIHVDWRAHVLLSQIPFGTSNYKKWGNESDLRKNEHQAGSMDNTICKTIINNQLRLTILAFAGGFWNITWRATLGSSMSNTDSIATWKLVETSIRKGKVFYTHPHFKLSFKSTIYKHFFKVALSRCAFHDEAP